MDALRPLLGFIARSPGLMLLGLWLILAGAGPALRSRISRVSHGVVTLATIVTAVVFGAKVAWYLSARPGFDLVSVQMAAVSKLVLDGQPLYHDSAAPVRYALFYGPVPYLFNGLVLELLPASVTTLKLAHVALFVAAAGLVLWVLRRVLPGRAAFAAWIVWGGLCLCFGHIAFVLRSDALILCSVAVALAAAAGAGDRGWARAAVVALAAGVAIGCKVHAGVYFLPVWGLLLARFGAGPALASALGSVTASLLPFVHPGISLETYLAYLRSSVRHAYSPYLLGLNLAYGAWLLLPLMLLGARSGRTAGASRVLAGTLVLAAGAIAVLAGKQGAGPHHFLPLLAPLVYVCARLWKASDAPEAVTTRPLALAWILTSFLVFTINHAFELRDIRAGQGPRPGAALDRIMGELGNETVQIGLGADPQSLDLTYLAPELVLAGQPYWFDPASLFDLGSAGFPIAASSRELIASCRTRYWLIPRGEPPFTVPSLYPPHAPLFDASFREAFRSAHRKMRASGPFDIWVCERPADAGEGAAFARVTRR